VESGSQLVGRAGNTMQDVVNAVRQVTEILGEISAASQQQSHSVQEVSSAVVQMRADTRSNHQQVDHHGCGG